MSTQIIHIGIDVDDQAFHGSALLSGTGEVIEFKCRPHADGLIKKIKEIQNRFQGHAIKVCYEATYIGFTLQRALTQKSIHCDVIAPGSIPRTYGNQVKTDRIDARKLAQFYANSMLSIVQPPDEETEQDRNLLRSRQFIRDELTKIRTHMHGLLRRSGRHFKVETESKSHWTQAHLEWIEKIAKESGGSLRTNLELLLRQMHGNLRTLAEYDSAIEQLSKAPKYEKPVQALLCYRGVKELFAMTIITEIGDVKRFNHPRKLVSWMGLDIREYSSGGSHNRFGITRQGNRYLRTAFVEANQKIGRSSTTGKGVRLRREKLPLDLVEIAKRCDTRLNKKGNRLIFAGKHRNKVKVACAREMVGFVWESLNKVAA